MAGWDFSRDMNMYESNVMSFLTNSVLTGKNPAAKPSTLNDFGFWDYPNMRPTPLGQMLLNGEVTWREAALLQMSKRPSSYGEDNSISPFVILCKTFLALRPYGITYLCPSDVGEFLLGVESYDAIDDGTIPTQIVGAHEHGAIAGKWSDYDFLDIWCNAFCETGVFSKDIDKNLIVAPAPIAMEVVRQVASRPSAFGHTPSKTKSPAIFYNYMGEFGGGIADIILDYKLQDIMPYATALRAEDIFCNEVFMTPDDYRTLTGLLEVKRNLVLQGAPGVGKTFAASRLAWAMMGRKDPNHVTFVQFHQSYCYEDFVGGYKPTATGFSVIPGVFFNACKKALEHEDQKCFFIIDEINRGNMSKVFGELLMLIESDKRGTSGEHDYVLALPNADEFPAVDKDYAGHFFVPKNLYIIGMMNTADRSLAMIDYALRRRFSFFEMEPAFDSTGFNNIKPDPTLYPKYKAFIGQLKALNSQIKSELGSGFCIGHSYFCKKGLTLDECKKIVRFEIYPMLQEYWFDDDGSPKKADTWLSNLENTLK